MEPITFEKVWYLSGDSLWRRIFRLIAYQDVGKLIVNDSRVEFIGYKSAIAIDRIRRVSFGKQGRDFMNYWVRIEYDEGSSSHVAFFADGGSLGWDGVFGGTNRIFEAVKRASIAIGN